MPAPEPGQTWGIFGGTFDPVHRGHISLASEIRKARQLEGIILVPTYDPPHRTSAPVASFQSRVDMLRLASQGVPFLMVSTIEAELPRPSYTLQTVRTLREKHMGVDFRFVIGADNLHLLRNWHKWETLLEEIGLLVGCRPGADLSELEQFPRARIDLIETSLVDISSTEIRQAVKRGASVEDLKVMVPGPVAEHIVAESLYL